MFYTVVNLNYYIFHCLNNLTEYLKPNIQQIIINSLLYIFKSIHFKSPLLNSREH